MNQVPKFYCEACSDSGLYEICDPSTDGLVGYRKCDVCPKLGRIWKILDWRTTSREIWVPSVADKKRAEMTEVPF